MPGGDDQNVSARGRDDEAGTEVTRRIRDIAGDIDRDYGVEQTVDVLLGKRGVEGEQE